MQIWLTNVHFSLMNIKIPLGFFLTFTKFYLCFILSGWGTGAGLDAVNVSEIKLLPARSGLSAAVPVTRTAPGAFQAPVRTGVRRAAARRAEALPVPLAEAAPGAPILLASAYVVQHIAQEAMAPARPAPSVLAAYAPAPPAAFEGLNFRTLA